LGKIGAKKVHLQLVGHHRYTADSVTVDTRGR